MCVCVFKHKNYIYMQISLSFYFTISMRINNSSILKSNCCTQLNSLKCLFHPLRASHSLPDTFSLWKSGPSSLKLLFQVRSKSHLLSPFSSSRLHSFIISLSTTTPRGRGGWRMWSDSRIFSPTPFKAKPLWCGWWTGCLASPWFGRGREGLPSVDGTSVRLLSCNSPLHHWDPRRYE